MTSNNINRIKVVLAELNVKHKWLADKLGKSPTTVSQWCTNTRQPSLEQLVNVAEVLNVDIKDLINPTK